MRDEKKIEGRQDFLNLIDYILENNHKKYSEFGKWNNPQIKTYLIESNVSSETINNQENFCNFIIKKTRDKNFYRISSKNFRNAGFLETSNNRIWKFFSPVVSDISDRIVTELVDNTIYLDRCWHTNQQLEKLELSYKFRGIGISYTDFFEKNKDERSGISLKLWTKGALKKHEKEIYEFVENKFARRSTRIQEIIDGKSIFLKEVFFNGKITTTFAKSPEEIINFSTNLQQNYIDILKKIENERGVFGSPVELLFKEKLPIDKIVNYFKSGKNPFRLWLSPIEKKENFVRLFGVDLHTGEKIGLDIGEDFIWINIPKKTCGNAGLRIPTILCSSFPYRVQLKLGGEELIA